VQAKIEILKLFILLVVISSGCGNDESTKLKIKEFELKEREAEVEKKKKDLNQTVESNTISQAKKFIEEWVSSTNNKDPNLGRFYDDYVKYYKGGLMKKSQVLEDKRNFFNRWDRIEITTEQYVEEKISEDEYAYIFDKHFSCSSYSKNKNYNGKVRSRLILKEYGGTLKIISENDEEIYYTNKNY